MSGSTGQDWAGYQPAAPPTTGLSFVIVKATEGTGYVNPRHDAQIATGRAHGLVVGHYHYAKAGPVADQVAYFLRHAAPQPGDILALDWEDTGVSSAAKDAWIKQAQAAAPGHRVLLYCNRDFWLHRDSSGLYGDGLWIADPDQPAGHPAVEAPWLVHQYSEAGGYDHDFSHLDPAAFRAWAAGNPTPEDDVPLTPTDISLLLNTRMDDPTDPGKATITVRGALWAAYGEADKAANASAKLLTQVTALSATVQTLSGLVGSGVDTAAVVAAVEQAIAAAVVHVDVDVTGPTS